MLIEWAKVSVPLAVVVIGGAIAWLSALAVRRWDRLIDGRAALVAAFEERLSATEYLFEDLKAWQSAGWRR